MMVELSNGINRDLWRQREAEIDYLACSLDWHDRAALKVFDFLTLSYELNNDMPPRQLADCYMSMRGSVTARFANRNPKSIAFFRLAGDEDYWQKIEETYNEVRRMLDFRF